MTILKENPRILLGFSPIHELDWAKALISAFAIMIPRLKPRAIHESEFQSLNRNVALAHTGKEFRWFCRALAQSFLIHLFTKLKESSEPGWTFRNKRVLLFDKT